MEAGVRVESHPENSSGRLLRSGLKGDAEIRNLFLEAFNERRSGEERAGFMADLESEMRRQIAAFANRDRESVIGYAKRYDAARTGGAVSYLKAETADLDAALEAGYFDYKPNPRRVTLERLLRGDLPGDILSLPRDTIIMPVMSCGMFFASGIISALMEHGFSPDIAMAGYPRHELFWKNGESVAQKVYVTPETAAFLRKNNRRTVLLVDDVIESGETMAQMRAFLAGLGFERIYQVVFYANNPEFASQSGILIRAGD
ncbi:hypothetical protein M1589_03200 [Candidatus Marsarchaeota archaeon]|jgi:phosphoribosylpyrophosphate synthetase|nr:hypothetical protein [Candidatus Marsarchaeota archaeon]